MTEDKNVSSSTYDFLVFYSPNSPRASNKVGFQGMLDISHIP